jgi:Flp pilus assembly protein TadB
MKRIRWLIPPVVTGNALFVVSTAIASFWLFAFCANYLRNPMAGIISVFACILTFSQAFSLSAKKSAQSEEYTKQLPAALRIFGAVLSDTASFFQALESAAERSPMPVKKILAKVHEKINDGESPVDALQIIPRILKTSHSEILANVMTEAYRHGTAALPMFITLADQIDNNHRLELKNKSFLVPARISRLIMHVFIVVLVAMTTIMVPDAHKYVIDPVGKMLITLYFISVILSVVADKMFGMVDG